MTPLDPIYPSKPTSGSSRHKKPPCYFYKVLTNITTYEVTHLYDFWYRNIIFPFNMSHT